MTSTPQSKETHIVILGASRGVGHYVLLKQLLNPHVRITLLLRNPDAIASDTVIKPHIVTGRVTLNQGDATKPEDLAVLFSEHVDAVLVTIGMITSSSH